MSNRVLLVGIDPGIVDTGVVWIDLDPEKKTINICARVWKNVTYREGKVVKVSPTFLQELEQEIQKNRAEFPGLYVFIEGYRNRGRNPIQDQKMLMLVQTIHGRLKKSEVVDNTGVKNVVTDHVLKLLSLYHWDQPTRHGDLRSAARIALKGAYGHPVLNLLVATVVRDQLKGGSWTLTNYQGS